MTDADPIQVGVRAAEPQVPVVLPKQSTNRLLRTDKDIYHNILGGTPLMGQHHMASTLSRDASVMYSCTKSDNA